MLVLDISMCWLMIVGFSLGMLASLWSERSILLSTRRRMAFSSLVLVRIVDVLVSSLKLGGMIVRFETCDIVAMVRRGCILVYLGELRSLVEVAVTALVLLFVVGLFGCSCMDIDRIVIRERS